MRVASLQLTDGSSLPISDFTVIIGGNGVGKSTLLRELFHRATDRAITRFRWLSGITYDEPEPQKSAKLLLESMAFHVEEGTPGRTRYRSRALKGYEGSLVADSLLEKEAYDQLSQLAGGQGDGQHFVGNVHFRRPFFASHSCDHRLNVPNRVGINTVSQPPQDALNVLWRHPSLRKAVADSVKARFGVDLVLLDHRASEIELGISDVLPPQAPAGEYDRQAFFGDIERWKEEHWVPITEAGHGIRAMTNLLLSVFEPVNRVILIDEPELFLYPPQKHVLGGTLVKLAKEEGKQVILVTHDSTFLQGVLDTTSEATILRVCFGSDKAHRFVKPCQLSKQDAVGAIANQREYLNALFHEHVVLVEGASDRAFYQGIVDLFQIKPAQDVGFVVNSGKGAALNSGSLCHRVGVPFAAIFDFDVLLPEQLPLVEKLLGLSGKLPPPDLASAINDAVGEAKAAMADKTSDRQALAELKRAGIHAKGLSTGTKNRITAVMAKLANDGIFVLEGGELESWCPSVEAKARFAEQALEFISQDVPQGNPVRDFIDRVFGFLDFKANAGGA